MAELLTKNVSPPVRPAEVSVPEPVVDDGVWWDVDPGGMRFTFQDLYDLINANGFDISELSGANGKLGNIGDVDTSSASAGFILMLDSGGVWRADDFSVVRTNIQNNNTNLIAVDYDAAIRDSSDVTRFAAIDNVTLTSVASPEGSFGVNSIRMRSNAAGNMTARSSDTYKVEGVVPGAVFNAYVRFRAQAATRMCRFGIEWRNSSGNVFATTFSDTAENAVDSWVQVGLTSVVAPANAVSMTFFYEIIGTATLNEDHYFDDSLIQRRFVSREFLNFINFAVVDDPANNRIDVELDTAALDQAVQDVEGLAVQLETDVANAIADMKREAFKAAIIFGGR